MIRLVWRPKTPRRNCIILHRYWHTMEPPRHLFLYWSLVSARRRFPAIHFQHVECTRSLLNQFLSKCFQPQGIHCTCLTLPIVSDWFWCSHSAYVRNLNSSLWLTTYITTILNCGRCASPLCCVPSSYGIDIYVVLYIHAHEGDLFLQLLVAVANFLNDVEDSGLGAQMRKW